MIEPISITESAPGIWTITWDKTVSPGDNVDVWLYGIRIAEGVTTGMVKIQHPGCPPVEIVEANEEAEMELANSVGEISWRRVQGAERYVVQRRVQGEETWVTVATYLEEGRGHFLWRGQVEEDGAVVEYRVCAERKGTQAEGETIVWPVVRHPKPPVVEFSVIAGSSGPVVRVDEYAGGEIEI